VLKVVMRVFGLLLCGLAVQLMILGGQDLGVIPRDVAAGGRH
jgi:small neutral amino acid transporter SnatA (MarC family)